MQNKDFILGKGKMPDWFNEKCLEGKARVDYDDEGNILGATVHTPTKTVKAKIGDSIMLIKAGLQVIPKNYVKKYDIQKGKKENEEVSEENKSEME